MYWGSALKTKVHQDCPIYIALKSFLNTVQGNISIENKLKPRVLEIMEQILSKYLNKETGSFAQFIVLIWGNCSFSYGNSINILNPCRNVGTHGRS